MAQGAVLIAEPDPVDTEPTPLPVPSTSTMCPNCGCRPTNKRDRELLRDALSTVWLAVDSSRLGEVVERWYCDQCQPHGAELILCPCSGDSVMISVGLAGQADDDSAVARWLTGHGWIHRGGTWYCGQHSAVSK
jgi:hypothetical protein